MSQVNDDKRADVTCVGIILDGNRRWAKAKGLPKLAGHSAGVKTVNSITRFARDAGVKHLVIYAFSTENWKREPKEVSYLMNLFRDALRKEMRELGKEGVRIRFIGQRKRFSDSLQSLMLEIEKETSANQKITLWCGLSYGGRAEVLEAVRSAAYAKEDITEESFSKYLWTKDMPDPDIIIRTGGEKRLSNFLPWQSIYSELFFTDTLCPDFSTKEFGDILSEFSARERRHGK